MLSKVFIQRIGEIMNHKILKAMNNSNDEPPGIGSILWLAHLIGLKDDALQDSTIHSDFQEKYEELSKLFWGQLINTPAGFIVLQIAPYHVI